jgi:indolepyruvate ferredoxin oxidoreductase alpha subunit
MSLQLLLQRYGRAAELRGEPPVAEGGQRRVRVLHAQHASSAEHPVNEAETRDVSVRAASFRGMTRFVVDCATLLRIAAGEVEVAAGHQLVAPTLVRSQALSALSETACRGEISAADGMERVTRINSLKVRFLGDKVLQRTAWRVAAELGWETTYDAEFVALTQLQADVFVTSDDELARAVSGLVETATIDALRTA